MNSKRLRIAITHTRYSYTGGVEKYIYSLVDHLLRAGHEVHYFAARFERCDHPRFHPHRVPWIRFPGSVRVLSFNLFLNRALARGSFDLVHGFTKTNRQDVYTDGSGCVADYVDATWEERSPWRRRFHRLTPHQLAIAWLERRRFRKDAIYAIVPMARFVAEQILRRYPVDPRRIEVVYNGVDAEHFHPRFRDTLGAELRRRHEIGPERPVLLFVGNDWERKGLATALDACARLARDRRPPPLLLVAGQDNHPNRYREHAAALGLEHHVVWLGPMRETRDAFAAADAFLFPSRYDVFGNVGLEALASGVPAVLSRRAGVSEILDGGAAGAVLENPRDDAALASLAARLLEREQLEARRAAARALAERFSWEHHFARIREIYERVLVEKRAERARAPEPVLQAP